MEELVKKAFGMAIDHLKFAMSRFEIQANKKEGISFEMLTAQMHTRDAQIIVEEIIEELNREE